MTDFMRSQALIVEDEPIVGLLVEEMLEQLGYDCSLATSLGDGLLAVTTELFAVSVLDVNLDGEESFPIADVLSARGQKFIFATGYGSGMCLERFPGVPVLTKPYLLSDLIVALKDVGQP